LGPEKIKFLIETVCAFEGLNATTNVVNTIVECSNGRPRNALVALEQAKNIGLENEDLIIKTLSGYDEASDPEVIELCKALSFEQSSWSRVMSIYKNINSEPDTIRIIIAGFFRSILEKAQNQNTASKAAASLGRLITPLSTPKPENSLVLNLYYIYTTFHSKF
jgi:hypothetical protein